MGVTVKSDIKGSDEGSANNPMYLVYIYNNSKDNPKRLKIYMTKEEVRSHIFAAVEDQTSMIDRWEDLPKKGSSK